MKPIPKDNLFTIHYNQDGKIIGVELWHPIDGVWRHIFQDYNEENEKLYTDGVGQLKNNDTITVPTGPQPKTVIHKNKKMKFRDMEIDDVIVVGPLKKEEFLKELKALHNNYIVIDLQYSLVRWEGRELKDASYHSALALVRNKK